METFILVKDQGASGLVLERFSVLTQLLSAQMRKDQSRNRNTSRNHSLQDPAGRSRAGPANHNETMAESDVLYWDAQYPPSEKTLENVMISVQQGQNVCVGSKNAVQATFLPTEREDCCCS